MAGTGRLQADPLFQGLARPTMILGVSYTYFVLNAMVTMITFINTKNFLMLLVVAPIIHGIGYLVCMKEPRAIELLLLRGKEGYKSWNNMLGYHSNTNSYDLF
jgi:type IV secretion system protein VirB3